jgi:hypothetical protein
MSASSTKYERFPSLRLYDRAGVKYVVAPNITSGPIWTGDVMLLDTYDEYGDASFFHELAHFFFASPRQRTLPDFGLDRHVNSKPKIVFTSSATPHLFDGEAKKKHRRARGWGEKCVSPATAERQEIDAVRVMAMYEPLVGLVEWTDLPDVDFVRKTMNTAFFDFGGDQDSRYVRLATRRRWYERFVSQVCDVTFESFDAYYRAALDAGFS